MSEWIKRSEQEPPRDGIWILVIDDRGTPWTLQWRESAWRDPRGFIPQDWKVWLVIEEPPRTVKIELPADVARRYSAMGKGCADSHIGDYESVAEACRRALEEQR